MALIIKATKDKKITISGTTIELQQVYGRIRFLGDYSGTTIQAEVSTFANYQTFTEGKILYTDVPIGNYQSELAQDEVQSLETAHKYGKLAYEQQGYEVVIDLA
mgnify:FL=1|jgi:hypothetical protein